MTVMAIMGPPVLGAGDDTCPRLSCLWLLAIWPGAGSKPRPLPKPYPEFRGEPQIWGAAVSHSGHVPVVSRSPTARVAGMSRRQRHGYLD